MKEMTARTMRTTVNVDEGFKQTLQDGVRLFAGKLVPSEQRPHDVGPGLSLGRSFRRLQRPLAASGGPPQEAGRTHDGRSVRGPLRDIQVLFRFELLFNHSFNLMNAFRIRREPIRRWLRITLQGSLSTRGERTPHERRGSRRTACGNRQCPQDTSDVVIDKTKRRRSAASCNAE